MPPFSRILIANRGEIACRIIRTARRMGIGTVAVYSEADRNALHVRLADEAIHIGPATATESYLRSARIIEAAQVTGAEAIHPGYGFLSENPDFVESVEAAGLVFIGPSAESIRAMGLKDAAKRLMLKAGVPVVPGYHGEAQELVVLATQAREIGYPVLIKARAGGGGKGMRKVEQPEKFADALAACRREAKASFNDDRVLVEKYIDRPRHIEVQVFGDSHGNIVHLFERDCSAQRRHQKVIEEAPAPGMTPEMRAAMCEAALAAAKAIRYRGAGTIEFIVDASAGLQPDRFWFMEMNTRLQVEHPVTEMITGLDLVEWQLRVAAGERLPLAQDDIPLAGHAFEARIYAEDPARDFLPAVGEMHVLRMPDPAGGKNIRIDTGIAEGDKVSAFYDPMIAKLIVHGEDRADALQGLVKALADTRIAGATTNLAFLHALASDSGFAIGEIDTGMIERSVGRLTESSPPSRQIIEQALVAAAGFTAPASQEPWERLRGYAHFHPLRREIRLSHAGSTHIALAAQAGPYRAAIEIEPGVPIVLPLQQADVATWPGHVTVFKGPQAYHFQLHDPFREAEETSGGDRLTAPMPGVVKLVRVRAGSEVAKGQPLLILEAMKMEHTIVAPHAGTILDITAEGMQVSDGTVLVQFVEDLP